jgi:hypothetical protein
MREQFGSALDPGAFSSPTLRLPLLVGYIVGFFFHPFAIDLLSVSIRGLSKRLCFVPVLDSAIKNEV